jgi:TP901 family phage tail tape measure protein
LRLVHDSFTKGAKASADSLKGIGDQAAKTSKRTGDSWQQLGKSVSGLGDSLSTKLTLPIVGLGAIAVKTAADFDASFTQMQTLAGLSGDAVAGLKDEVLALASETGRAPQELADAYYFLASSGLEAAEAMDALEVSAKASAAGLGPTEVIADAVSSAMLGYAESGLKAAEATDILIATARAGKAEPAELAAQMGRLIPTAAELGISFADVGGAIAALSTKGNDAAAATTQLTNVMGKLMKPSQQANEALEGVGLSTERIRELIAEKGLLGTLEILKDRLGDSGFTKFFEDQQAVQGALALTGGDLNKTRDIFEQVNDSVGSTDKAFATWAESMGAQNARAFADFQVALIKLGEVIAPIAADLLSFAASVVSAFGDLPEPVQNLVIAFAGLMAAVGPVLSVGGRLITAWGGAMKLFDNWSSAGGQAFADAMNGAATSTSTLSSRLAGVGRLVAAGGIIVTGFMLVGEAAEKAFGRTPADITKLENALLDFADSSKVVGEFSKVAGDDLGKLHDAMQEVFDPSLGDQWTHTWEDVGSLHGLIAGDINELEKSKDVIDDVDKALAQLAGRDPEMAAKVFREITDQLGDMGVQSGHVKDAFDDYSSAVAGAETANRTAEGATESETEAMADQEQAVNEAAAAFANYADTVKATFDPVFGLLNSLRQNDEAQRTVTESLTALTEAREEHGRNSAEAAAAEVEYQSALIAVGESAAGVQVAAAGLNAAVAENPALVDSAKASLEQWVAQGLLTQEQAGFLAEQFDVTALQAKALGETDPTVEVTETGSRRTRDQLTQVENSANRVPPRRNTHMSTSGFAAASTTIGNMIGLISQIPSNKTVNLNARLGGSWGSVFGLTGRASGGPVSAGRLYEVAEQGRAELLEMRGRSYLIPGSNGTVIPAGPMTSGAAYGGGSVTNITVDMGRGVFVGSRREFKDAVQQAFNDLRRTRPGLAA